MFSDFFSFPFHQVTQETDVAVDFVKLNPGNV